MEGRGTSRSLHAIDTVALAPMDRGNMLPWKKFQRHGFKLQKRIYRASSGPYDQRHVVEEPDEAKASRPVLEPSRHGDIPA